MINILLTDDHALIRTGIRRLLEDSGEVVVIGEAECGEDAIRLVPELNPDITFMDVSMPGIGGVEACRRILQRDPDQKIIVLTVHGRSDISKANA